MMDKAEMSRNYWKYYLMLEKRFIDTINYIELHEDNFDSFSNEYALILQAIGAELDIFFKEFCEFNKTDRKSISDYATYVLGQYSEIKSIKIILKEYNIEIQPFETWDAECASQSLEWWEAFTLIKHNRYEMRQKAKQKNVLNALGALYLLEMIYLKRITDGTQDIDVFDIGSSIFTLEEWSSKAVPITESFNVLGQMLSGENANQNVKFDVN